MGRYRVKVNCVGAMLAIIKTSCFDDYEVSPLLSVDKWVDINPFVLKVSFYTYNFAFERTKDVPIPIVINGIDSIGKLKDLQFN